MVLALYLARYQGKLRADFQQFYGLNLDGMGKDYSISHAAFLCAELPKEARVIREISPSVEWDDTKQLLALIERNVRVLAWLQTKDAQKRRNYPEIIDPYKKKTQSEICAVSIEELNNILHIKEG